MPSLISSVSDSRELTARREGVKAAGEAEISKVPGMDPYGITMNRYSGHFEPSPESLEIGVQAFADAGIPFGRWILISQLNRQGREPRSRLGPEWPADDPAGIVWWLEEGGAQELGHDVSKWLRVIYSAAWPIMHGLTARERRDSRDLTLVVIDKAWSCGGLPEYLYAEQRIYVRMLYIRTSDEESQWLCDEMARVLEIFIESAPFDLESMRHKARVWRDQPVGTIVSLRQVKSRMQLMMVGLKYLDSDNRQIFQEWLDLLPLLP